MTTQKNYFPHADMMDYVDDRLHEWADWFSRGCYSGIGYPNKSMIALMREYQGAYVRTSGSKPLPINEKAEEIEVLVAELSQQNERLAKVLRHNYFSVGTAARKARQIDLSYAHFKVQLDMAKQWLAGRLTRTNLQLCPHGRAS